MATRESDIPTYRSPFANWDLNKAATALTESKGEGYDDNKNFIQGKHWMDGAGWVGPPDRSSPAYTASLQKIGFQFTFRDAINEVANRIVNGVAKQEAKLGTAPRNIRISRPETDIAGRESERKAAQGLVAMCSTWWENVGFHEKLKEAIKRSRWAVTKDGQHGRACLRLWIPTTQLQEIPEEERESRGIPAGTRRVPNGSLETTMMRIHVDAPDPEACTIVLDDETQQRASLFSFKRDNKDLIEIAWVEYNPDGSPGDTIVRILGSKGEGDTDEEYRWSLGGRLPVIEMRAPLLITEAVRRQQKRLNFFETSLMRNVETAGFPERHITNAEPSGILVLQDPKNIQPYATREINGQIYEIHPVPRVMGAGITTESVGITLTDEDGKKTIATPGVHRFDPVDPAGTIRACRHAYQTLLEEANQAHILIVGDATASGVSRQQAEGDHISDLSDTKGPAESMVRETLETMVAMASFFSGASQNNLLTLFRITAKMFLTPGTPNADQQRQAMELWEHGAIDTTEMLSRIGIEDTTEMEVALASDPMVRLVYLDRRAKTMDALQTAGWTFEGAAAAVGFTEEEITKARTGTFLTQTGGDDEEDEDEDEEDPPTPPKSQNPGQPNGGREVP